MENKKKFENPEAVIVEFIDNDIIMTSGPGGTPGQDYDDWDTGFGN